MNFLQIILLQHFDLLVCVYIGIAKDRTLGRLQISHRTEPKKCRHYIQLYQCRMCVTTI